MPEAPNTDVNTTPILHQEPTQQELSLQQETSHIRLVDKETALRMEKEEKGRWVTVSELIEEKKLPRMTVWNRIKRGKYVVTYDDKKCNRYGHQYLIWVPSIPFTPDAIPSAIPNDGAAIPFSSAAIPSAIPNDGAATPFSPAAIPSAIPNDGAATPFSPAAIPNDTNIVKDEKENIRNYMRKLKAISRVNYVDEEEAQRMEEEGKGIWATTKEYAEIKGYSRQTISKIIKKYAPNFHVTLGKKQTKHGYSNYLILVTDPDEINQIIEYRHRKQKIQSLKLIISQAQLLSIYKQGGIDRETLSQLMTDTCSEFQISITIQSKIFNNLCKKAKILKIEKCMEESITSTLTDEVSASR